MVVLSYRISGERPCALKLAWEGLRANVTVFELMRTTKIDDVVELVMERTQVGK